MIRLPARELLCAGTMLAAALAMAHAESPAARLSHVPGNERRLDLDLESPLGWTIRQHEDLVEIRFPGISAEIELPTAIRAPVSDVSTETRAGETYLRFVLGCACTVAIADHGGGPLHLDFVDARAEARPHPAPQHAPMPSPKRFGASDDVLPGASASAGEINVAETRERLMAQLLRAAEAGLIELDGVERPGDAADRAADAGSARGGGANVERSTFEAGRGAASAAETTDAPTPTVTEHNAGASRARISGDGHDTTAHGPDNSSDTALENVADHGAWNDNHLPVPAARATNPTDTADAVSTPAECLADDAFELPQFASGSEWAGQVAELRGRLTGEFDRADQAVVGDLARAYLGAGFGEEALAVLRDFGDGSAAQVVLAEIASLLSDRPLGESATLSREDCVGAQALWRAVGRAVSGAAEAAVAAEQGSGRSLEKLPSLLRQDIAARLGLAAADAGAWEIAREMLAMVNRSAADADTRSGRAVLLQARLAGWEQDSAAKRRALNQARKMEPEVASAATLLLAEDVLRSGARKTPGLVGLVADLGILSRMTRGTPDGKRAAALEVRVADLAEGRQSALDLLALGLSTGALDEAEFTRILSELADGEDATRGDSIASIYLADPAQFGPALADDRFRRLLARSLVQLGLPAQAATLLGQRDISGELLADLALGFIKAGDHQSADAMIAKMPETPERRRLAEMSRALASGIPVAQLDGETPSATRLIALSRAALAAGDLERALDLASQRVAIDQSRAAAETAAMLALTLGRSELPSDAARVLEKEDPALLGRFAELLGEGSGSVDPADPAAAARYLSRLDAEIRVIEEMLNDG